MRAADASKVEPTRRTAQERALERLRSARLSGLETFAEAVAAADPVATVVLCGGRGRMPGVGVWRWTDEELSFVAERGRGPGPVLDHVVQLQGLRRKWAERAAAVGMERTVYLEAVVDSLRDPRGVSDEWLVLAVQAMESNDLTGGEIWRRFQRTGVLSKAMIDQAVAAFVRHTDTDYDDLLRSGVRRSEALERARRVAHDETLLARTPWGQSFAEYIGEHDWFSMTREQRQAVIGSEAERADAEDAVWDEEVRHAEEDLRRAREEAASLRRCYERLVAALVSMGWRVLEARFSVSRMCIFMDLGDGNGGGRRRLALGPRPIPVQSCRDAEWVWILSGDDAPDRALQALGGQGCVSGCGVGGSASSVIG